MIRIACLITILSACGDDDRAPMDAAPRADAGARSDAGPSSSDAGALRDAATADSGPGIDAGPGSGCTPTCRDMNAVCVDSSGELCEVRPTCTSFPGSTVYCGTAATPACSLPPGVPNTVGC
jgi:hypothetical protein